MSKKGFVLTCIGLLALIIALQGPAHTPNQEIILEFNTKSSYHQDAKRTLASVQRELKAFGATGITVFTNKHNQTLTISYYSANDIAAIEKILLQSRHVNYVPKKDPASGTASLPFDTNFTQSYTVAVHKIDEDQNSVVFTSQLGILQFERIKIDPLQLKNSGFIPFTTIKQQTGEETTTEKISGIVTFSIFSTYDQLPECRAGPMIS